jgi:hypothetical protein
MVDDPVFDITVDRANYAAGDLVTGSARALSDLSMAPFISVGIQYLGESEWYVEEIEGVMESIDGGMAIGEARPFAAKLPDSALPAHESTNGSVGWHAVAIAGRKMRKPLIYRAPIDVAAAASSPTGRARQLEMASRQAKRPRLLVSLVLIGLIAGGTFAVADAVHLPREVPIVVAVLGGLLILRNIGAASSSPSPINQTARLSATLATDVVRRGSDVAVDLRLAQSGYPCRVGLRCIERTDADFSMSEGTERRTSEAEEVWKFIDVDDATAEESVSLTVPVDAPFTLDANPVGYRWTVEVQPLGEEATLSTPLTVLP